MNRKQKKLMTYGAIALGIVILIVLVYYFVYKKKKEPEIEELEEQPNPPEDNSHAPPPPVMTGDSQQNQQHSGDGKPTLVLFHAGWCGFCKAMLPAWKEASDIINSSGHAEAIALDQETYGEEMKTHGVGGFPEIRLYPTGFPGNNPIKYQGDRSAQSFVNFVKSMGRST